MFLYAFLSRLFPRSFAAKLLLIAFVGTHVPLIATVAYLFALRGGLRANLDLGLVLLSATLLGTAATLLSIHVMLRPLLRVRDAMRAFERARERRPLPTRFRDELGDVMAMTNRLVLGVDAALRDSRDAASTDPLTGALNRRGLMDAAEGMADGGLVFCDLDHFKALNDRLGHEAGDAALVALVGLLRAKLRQEDRIARYGGEEFVILLPGLSAEAVASVAERLRKAVADGLVIRGMPVTASFGTAMLDGAPFDDVLRQADRALYAAKARGRNLVVPWAAASGAAA